MKKLCLFVVLNVCCWSQVYAEFLKTGVDVYQSMGKRTKVIITNEPSGIFLLYGPEVDLQVFNPAEVKNDEVQAHAFLRFDHEVNRYTALVIGKREYRVSGSFTLKLGNLRLTVDNSNPYCSIVVDALGKEGAKPEILGLLGLSAIVNFSGQQAVALLEANQLSEYRGVVDPYYVRDGQIYVKDRPIGSNALGIAFESRNECLSNRARIVPGEELRRISAAKSREDGKKALAALLEGASKKSPLRGLLRLRVMQDSLIAFDPSSGVINVVKKTGSGAQNPIICSMDEVRF